MSQALRIGTRRSTLARAQAGHVGDALTVLGREVEQVGVTTYGDTTSESLARIGGMGVFVSALRERLLAGDIDIAVHSLKDLPTQPAPGLVIAAVPGREDPFDALVARDGLTVSRLPDGAHVGTGSLRRAAQLLALRPGLQVASVRGNVDTRIGKVTSGEVDAVVLARAGLARLGRLPETTEALDPERMTPAPGQGALAVECREDHAELRSLLLALDDPPSRAAVTAERAVLATLEAGCSAPVGAYAEPVPDDAPGDAPDDAPGGHGAPELYVRAVVASADGQTTIRRSTRGFADDAESLGHGLAAEMLARGAAALMRAADPH